MSIRSRLAAAFAGIVACFVVSFGVTLWANRVRAARLEDLEKAVRRQVVIASVKRRLYDLQREIALLVGIYDTTSAAGVEADEQARFKAQLAAIAGQLSALKTTGSESVAQREFVRAFDELARSWAKVYPNLGRDTAAAITELSVHSDPLAETILREHLPRWEEHEKAQIESASRNLRRATAIANASTAAIFATSALIALAIAYRIFRYLLRINDELEARVVERTRALQQEVAEHRRTEQALRDSEERYAIAARGASDGLWDWKVRRGYVYYSPRWKEMLGYSDSELGNSPEVWLSRIHPEDREEVDERIRAHFERATPHFESEHRILHRDGAYRWMLCRGLALFDDDGAPIRMAGSQTDITVRKVAEERLLHDALHDALTGLANRALLLDRLEWLAARTKRHPELGFAVLFVDVDRFKVINDSLGHATGDQLLIGVARRIESCVRPGDTVARLGGDEFIVLLDEMTSVSDAEAIALRAQVSLAAPFHIGGHEIYTSASIGIALSAHGYEQPEDLVRDADAAMYRAKSLGGARHEVFDSAMRSHAVARLQIETALRRALDREEFLVEYQPIFRFSDESIVGFEALARWKREHVVVQPNEFIPIAEETGLIVPLGLWVLQTACRDVAEWRRLFSSDFSVSVNLSPRQFSERDLVSTVVDTLRRISFDPSHLILEITEGLLIENPDAAFILLHRLHGAQIRLCLDDFGTGYSSLNALHKYPIDMIKIDRTFVARIGTEGGDPHFAGAILTLARTLGVSVTAEGVETREQVEHLREMRCDYGQGFLLAPPLGKEAATEFLRSRQRAGTTLPAVGQLMLPPTA